MTMMQFTFEVPFKFERLFNFDNPWLARNNYWVESDSNPDYIKQFTYSRKQTLVKKLEISSFWFEVIKNRKEKVQKYEYWPPVLVICFYLTNQSHIQDP